jgi:hypothetical protein
LAGDLYTVRALVIAERSLDLLCGLIRRGCLAATAIRFGCKPDAKDYDLVVASPGSAAFSPGRLIRQVRRALAPNGRLHPERAGGNSLYPPAAPERICRPAAGAAWLTRRSCGPSRGYRDDPEPFYSRRVDDRLGHSVSQRFDRRGRIRTPLRAEYYDKQTK